MAGLIAITLFLLLTSVITYYGYRRYARPGRVLEQLNTGGGGSTLIMTHPASDEAGPGMLVTTIQQLGEHVPVNPEDATVIRGDLMAAGYRSEAAFYLFTGARILLCLLMLFGALAFRNQITSNGVLSVVIPIGAAILGYFGPSFYLDYLVSKRQERLRMGLPDALDLMVVAVEAGLGLDQAMRYVAREMRSVHPDLCEEFHLVNLEIRAGERRVQALRNLARRTGEPEMRKLVAMLVQTDRFGTSIGDSLRTHSDFMRIRRRQEAEERAGKIGVKLVFPIFFLILPAILVVVTGPGLLQIFKYLIPVLENASI